MLNLFRSIKQFLYNVTSSDSINDRIKKEFLEKNKNFYNKCFKHEDVIGHNDKKIYVVHIDKYLSLTLRENTLAKQLQKKSGHEVIAVSATFYNQEIEQIDKSFEIKTVSMVKELIRNWYLVIIPLFKTLWFMLRNPSIDGLIKLRYRNVPIGNPVYDQILLNMVDNNEGFTCKRLNWKNGFVELWEGMCLVELSSNLFKKNAPSCCIISESTYNRSIVARVAVQFGADILNTLKWDTYLLNNHEVRNMELNVREATVNHIKEILNKEKYDNKIKDIYNKSYDEEKINILENMGINNGLKNAIIMVHCFKDCPREQSKKMIYRDFYEWFEDTLKQIGKIKNVNWIIKDHPYSKAYGQYDEVKKLLKKYKQPNIIYYDSIKEINIVSKIADCVITVSGTTCIEAPSYGVCCIAAGIPYYSDFGYIFNSKSKEEYYRLLRNINSMKEMNRIEKRDAAEIKNIWDSILTDTKDEFNNILYDYDKVIFAIKCSSIQRKVATENLMKKYMILIEKYNDFDNIIKYNSKVKSYLDKKYLNI